MARLLLHTVKFAYYFLSIVTVYIHAYYMQYAESFHDNDYCRSQ